MIKLRDFSENHLSKTFKWMQNENLKNSFLLDKEITREGHGHWFKQIKDDNEQRIFAIIYQDTHVGNIGIKNIDGKNKKAETWIYIGDSGFKGKGFAAKSLVYLNERFHGEFQKFYAQIADFNIASIKTFSNAGYKLEGILPNELIFKGENITIYRFYILI